MTAVSDNSNETADPRVAEANRILVTAGEPEAAARLYSEAAQAGSGRAAMRLAVLAAMGVARPPDWNEALDRLADAAELADRPAQKQLIVLSGREDLATRTGGGALWRRVREEIDLKALLKPPPLQRIHHVPAIALIDGLATREMCRWIISSGKDRLERGKVSDDGTGEWVPDPVRTGLAAPFGILDTDMVMVTVQERLARASGLVVHQQEAPHLLSYEPGQEYKAHYDFLLPTEPAFQRILAVMGQRVATCLTWLNDDYDGGETEFPRVGWRHRGKPGDAMLFLNVTTPGNKPDRMSLHAGLPPKRGRKWLLSQWVRDRMQPIV